jgi:hypothetical protein
LIPTDDGAALLLVMIVVLVLAGLAFAAVSLADLEGAASVNDAHTLSVAYAADAAVERVIDDLGAVTDWTTALAGGVSSVLRSVDPRPPSPWGELLDLDAMTREVQADPDVGVGPDQTRWRVFLAGPLASMMPGPSPATPSYIVAWIGDDDGDGDGNPWVDANRVLRIRARAVGPRGLRADREAVIERDVDVGVVRARTRWKPL